MNYRLGVRAALVSAAALVGSFALLEAPSFTSLRESRMSSVAAS